MKKQINWVNTPFLVLTPIIAILGTIYLLFHGGVPWQTWVLSVVLTILAGLAVTAGYHRLFSHKSYKAHWAIRLFYVLFAASGFEGNVKEWCTDHRNHHRYTDTEKDPYNIKQGFWYAHIGWLITLDPSKRDFSNVEDLEQDKIVRFQEKFYIPLAILMGFGLPMALGALWGDVWGGLIVAGFLRIVFNHHMTFCINSVCHVFGKRTYSEQSARDNWFTAIFTFGEGFHNFHHQFPIDYRNGIRFFHFDPTKWLIRSLSWLGLAEDLKRVSAPRRVRYRLRHDAARLLEQKLHREESWIEHMSHLAQPLQEKILQLLNKIEELEKAYSEAKRHGLEQMQDKLVEYRSNLRQSRRELKRSMTAWTELVRHATKKTVVVA